MLLPMYYSHNSAQPDAQDYNLLGVQKNIVFKLCVERKFNVTADECGLCFFFKLAGE